MVRVALAIPDELRASYRYPGQYVRVVAGGESGHFVLAGPVGARDWQIVVRDSAMTDRLRGLRAGDPLDVTAALGSGFPVAESHGRELLVVVVGSGVAAACAIVSDRIASGDATTTRVLAGFRTPADVPLASAIDAWAAQGVSVTLCFSRVNPPLDASSASRPAPVARVTRLRGRVDHHLQARAIRHTGPIFVVGPEGLVDAVRAVARDLGSSPANVHTNV
jgi:NAD(P)H-flavin reductase